MLNNNLQTLMVSMIMAVGVTLSGCDSTKEDAQGSEVDAATTSEQTAVDASTQTTPTNTADLDGATAEQGTPVKYDVASWSTKKVKTLNIDQLDSIKATLGKVVSTDENSLDYASNSASKYRFMSTDAPYLDIIDSEKYLELGWYYANPTDSKKKKS